MPSATCRNCTQPFCGDGVKDENEQCDEGGNATATCRADCTLPICGDGIFDAATEECT